MPSPRHVIGIDVGSGSARAGLFDATGQLIAAAKAPITLYRESGTHAEQSSTEIWQAVCTATRAACQQAQLAPDQIAGIGIDATCSLVVLGENGRSVPVGHSGDPGRDIIVWMDHRASPQAARITALAHPVLRYVGGVISPEMQTPKLLWLQETLPERFAEARHFFDLTDFLTWKATGSLARSSCTLACKWTYLAHEDRWDSSYFHRIGLGILADEGFARIGNQVVAPGTALGQGLSATAAADLGLAPGTPVAAGLIDAHAGGLGTVGAPDGPGSLTSRMAYVFGTSACTMSTTSAPCFVPGVWGPYFNAMCPNLWLNEGGQSAAGAAIERILQGHPAAAEAMAAAQAQGLSLPDHLSQTLEATHKDLSAVALLAGPRLVVPDFNGNRSPHANDQARAVLAGLGTDTGINDLVGFYIAALCGLGYGLRQILDAQAARGLTIDSVVISGGAGSSALVRQLISDAIGLPVATPQSPEPVLLGAALLGAKAGGLYPDLTRAMQQMTAFGAVLRPATGPIAAWHAKRYAAFETLRATMASILADTP
jgi:D-ribulokinase